MYITLLHLNLRLRAEIRVVVDIFSTVSEDHSCSLFI